MKSGIDLSRWNNVVDWDLLPDDIGFVVMRASIGNYYTDPKFEDYFDAVCAKHLVTGAYHVLIADNEVESQLDRLELALNGRKPDMLVLDCELKGTVKENIRKRRTYWMMRKLDERWPTPVKLYYTNQSYWDTNIGSTYSGYRFDEFLLWIASYGKNDGQIPDTDKYPAIPDAWKDAIPQWWIWQYTSKGVIPGIEGNVDLNGMREDFFAKLDAKKECAATEPEPPIPPEPPSDLEDRVQALEDWVKSYPKDASSHE